jgi:hypothetical protein
MLLSQNHTAADSILVTYTLKDKDGNPLSNMDVTNSELSNRPDKLSPYINIVTLQLSNHQ